MKHKLYRREVRTLRMTPGSTAYPEAKADGDKSMPTESGSCPKAFTVESSRKSRATGQGPHCSNLSFQR
jgi:hypothetical protein